MNNEEKPPASIAEIIIDYLSNPSQCDSCNQDILDQRKLDCGHNVCLQCLQAEEITAPTCSKCRMVIRSREAGQGTCIKIEMAQNDSPQCRPQENTQPAILPGIHQGQIRTQQGDQNGGAPLEIRPKHYCDICKLQTPECEGRNLCSTCRYILCESCSTTHKEHKILLGHRLEEISRVAFCGKHSKEIMENLCKTCDSLICTLCFVHEHIGHTVIPIPKELETLYTKAQTVIEQYDQDGRCFKHLNSATDDLLKSIDARQQVIRNVIANVSRLQQHLTNSLDKLEQMKADGMQKISNLNLKCLDMKFAAEIACENYRDETKPKADILMAMRSALEKASHSEMEKMESVSFVGDLPEEVVTKMEKMLTSLCNIDVVRPELKRVAIPTDSGEANISTDTNNPNDRCSVPVTPEPRSHLEQCQEPSPLQGRPPSPVQSAYDDNMPETLENSHKRKLPSESEATSTAAVPTDGEVIENSDVQTNQKKKKTHDESTTEGLEGFNKIPTSYITNPLDTKVTYNIGDKTQFSVDEVESMCLDELRGCLVLRLVPQPGKLQHPIKAYSYKGVLLNSYGASLLQLNSVYQELAGSGICVNTTTGVYVCPTTTNKGKTDALAVLSESGDTLIRLEEKLPISSIFYCDTTNMYVTTRGVHNEHLNQSTYIGFISSDNYSVVYRKFELLVSPIASLQTLPIDGKDTTVVLQYYSQDAHRHKMSILLTDLHGDREFLRTSITSAFDLARITDATLGACGEVLVVNGNAGTLSVFKTEADQVKTKQIYQFCKVDNYSVGARVLFSQKNETLIIAMEGENRNRWFKVYPVKTTIKTKVSS